MTVEIPINITTKGAQDLLKRMADVRKEVSTLAIATKSVSEIPLGTQQQLRRMDQTIAKTSALRDRIAAVRKELQTTSTPRLLELAEKEAKESLVDVERLNASVKELRDGLENPVNNRLAAATQSIAAPRGVTPAGRAPVASLNDRTFGQIAGAASNFGIPGAGALRVAADVADLTENLPKLGAEIQALGVAGLATTAVVAGLAAIFYAVNKVVSDGADRIRKLSDQIERRVRLEFEIEELNAEQARERRTQLERDIELNKQLRDAKAAEFAEDIANIENFGDAVGTAFSGISAAAGFGDVGNIGAAKDEMEKLNDEADRLQHELELVNVALRENLEMREEERNVTQRGVDSEKRRIEAILQSNRDIESLTSQSAITQRNEVAERLRLNQELEEDLTAKLRTQLAARLQAQTDLLNASATGDDEGVTEAGNRLAAINERLGVLIPELEALGVTIDEDALTIQRFNSVVLPAIRARERENQLLEQYSDLSNRAAAALTKLTTAQQALADFEGQLATDELNKRRENSINAVYDAQLKAIDAEIERAKASERAQAIQEKAVELQVSTNEKVQDTNAKFMQSELARLAEFRKSEQRINDDFAREQRRRLQDLNDELSDASADNDVVAFIQAQKEGSKELARAAEDFNVESARRVEDFNRETESNHADHVRTLAEIDRQYQQQQLELRATAAGQELSLIEQLQSKRAEIIANRETSLEQFRQQLEVEQINRRRQALIAQMNAAQEEYRRLNELAITSGRVIGSNFMNSIISGASSQIQQAFNAVSNAVNKIRIPSFAGGGDVHRPTFAMVGDTGPGWSEKMIPYRTSRGFTMQDAAPHLAGGGGMPSVSVDLRGAQIGVDMSILKTEIVDGVREAWRGARATAGAS